MRIYRPIIIKAVNFSAISYEILGRQWFKGARVKVDFDRLHLNAVSEMHVL